MGLDGGSFGSSLIDTPSGELIKSGEASVHGKEEDKRFPALEISPRNANMNDAKIDRDTAE